MNFPADSSSGRYIYPVIELYSNGKRKLVGNTLNRLSKLSLQAACISFYPNGHRKSVINYEHGNPVGDVIQYYPNGNIYIVGKYGDKANPLNSKLSLIECHDSTGKVLAENGNGQWLKFDDDFKKIYEEGPVKDGIEDGSWTRAIDDKKWNFIYTKGIITTPIDYNLTGKIFSVVDVYPTYKGGIDLFYRFLERTMRYPAVDRENNITGKVIVSFVVEKDGTLSDMKIIKAPSKTLGAEAIRAVQSSQPWIPGSIASSSVRTTCTIPVNFASAKSN